MAQTIGVELEGFFTDGWGEPVNTIQRLGAEMRETGRPFEGLTADMGESSFEMVTGICESADDVRDSLYRVRRLFPKGLEALLRPRPFQGDVRIVEKERARVMRTALLAQHPRADGWCGIDKVAPWCATHFHVSVSRVDSPEAVLLLNFLNDIAPFARTKVLERFDVPGAAGHLMIWQGWCRSAYVPNWRWFKNGDELKRYIGEIPKLIKSVDGEWKLGNGARSSLGDNESEGTLWWLARPRGKLKTIEWRPFPSLQIEQVCELSGDVLELVHAFNAYVQEHREVLMPLEMLHASCFDRGAGRRLLHVRDWSPVQRMYAELARVSWLVPAERQFNDASVWWWQLYRT